jgi:hypothetical protein
LSNKESYKIFFPSNRKENNNTLITQTIYWPPKGNLFPLSVCIIYKSSLKGKQCTTQIYIYTNKRDYVKRQKKKERKSY